MPIFRFDHNNINVKDLDKAVKFYEDALGLQLTRTHEGPEGSFKLAFMSDGQSAHKLELTWLRDHPEAYDLGENESHLCFRVDNYDAAHALHEKMGCICYENENMGLYFINDPDGYWIEIVPVR